MHCTPELISPKVLIEFQIGELNICIVFFEFDSKIPQILLHSILKHIAQNSMQDPNTNPPNKSKTTNELNEDLISAASSFVPTSINLGC